GRARWGGSGRSWRDPTRADRSRDDRPPDPTGVAGRLAVVRNALISCAGIAPALSRGSSESPDPVLSPQQGVPRQLRRVRSERTPRPATRLAADGFERARSRDRARGFHRGRLVARPAIRLVPGRDRDRSDPRSGRRDDELPPVGAGAVARGARRGRSTGGSAGRWNLIRRRPWRSAPPP